MNGFMTSLRKELLEQWRTYRFLAVAVVLILFGILSPVTAKFLPNILLSIPGAEDFASLIPQPTVADAIGQYVKNIQQFSILLAVLVTMSAVAGEKERGTAALMLVKPLSRGAFLFSKFCAISLTLLVNIVVAGALAYFYTLYLFEAIDVGGWLLLNLLMWISFSLIVALTLLFSTLLRSPAAAAGASVGVILFVTILSAIPRWGEVLPGELYNWGAKAALGAANPAWTSLLVTLTAIVLCLVVAWQIFERQEL